MKKLYIIRHAKSSWDDESLDDFDRPLNKRGVNNAPMMGQRLHKLGVRPDLIISSPAVRALSTAQAIAKEVGYEKVIHENFNIYEAYVSALQEVVSYIHDDNEVVFLVGHNPGVNALAYMLCGFKEHMPTASIVEISFDCDSWMTANKENSTLISFDFPKKTE